MVQGPDTGGVRKPELLEPASLTAILRAASRCSDERVGAGARRFGDQPCVGRQCQPLSIGVIEMYAQASRLTKEATPSFLGDNLGPAITCNPR